jgi:hypothetical protein
MGERLAADARRTMGAVYAAMMRMSEAMQPALRSASDAFTAMADRLSSPEFLRAVSEVVVEGWAEHKADDLTTALAVLTEGAEWGKPLKRAARRRDSLPFLAFADWCDERGKGAWAGAARKVGGHFAGGA